MLDPELSESQKKVYGIAGIVLGAFTWWFFTWVFSIPKETFPGPQHVILALPDLFNLFKLPENFKFSLFLNIVGYMEATLLAVPIGYAIALNNKLYAMASPILSMLRYLPLLLLIGAFILWFGIGPFMKVQFLSTAIFVYLLPAVVDRVRELDPVYIQTAKTSGATTWQIIKTVVIPGTLAFVMLAVILLVAISWTYINAIEIVNANEGGIGAVAERARRASRIDVVFAVLFIIAAFALLQDAVAKWIHQFSFPYLTKGVQESWYKRLV